MDTHPSSYTAASSTEGATHTRPTLAGINPTRMISTVGQSPVMPQNREAEVAILSAMMMSTIALQECLIGLDPDDFYVPSHRMVFIAMRDLFNENRPVDVISLEDHLKTNNELERAGGRSFLIELGSNTLAVVGWANYMRMLRRDSTLRRMIHASTEITALAFDAPEDTKEVINQAEKLLLDVTNRDVKQNEESLGIVMQNLYDELLEISKADNTKPIGIMTGFKRIDEHLLGLRSGQMVVVGARPGVGKTSFALNLAINAAVHGASVAFFSLEMSKTEIAQRLLAANARISLQNIRSGRIQNDQWPQITEAINTLSNFDVMIDDTPGTTVTEIRAKARRMLRNKPRGVILIDYLQLLSPPSGQRRADSRATEVSEMSRGIKIMAKDLGVPVVALSQLNRSLEGRTGKRPQLSDLRESGSIEQDADIVLLLDRSMTEEEGARQDRPDFGQTDLIIAKNRSGALGCVPLTFLANSTKFVEVDDFHTN